MVDRRPIVRIGGRIKDLPVGDSLSWSWLSGLPVNIEAWAGIPPSEKFDKAGGLISGRVGVNATNVSENADGLLCAGGTFATASVNSVRGIRVDAIATVGSGFGYANFDAAGRTDGPNPVDHLIGFQSRPRHDGTGLMTRMYGYASLPNCGGPVSAAFGQYIFDIEGAGVVQRHTGLHIEPLAKALNNYAIWIDGPNPSVFGGAVWPKNDAVTPLGDPSLRWSELRAANGTINTSDAREKTPVRELTAQEIAAAIELGEGIGAYRWRAMIEAKGDAAREHIGLTVQRAIEIMQRHELDPFRYGFICYDRWEELPEIRHEWKMQPRVVDDFGTLLRERVEAGFEVVQQHRAAGDRYSFRMDELLAFMLAGERAARLRKQAEFETRIAALEARA